MFVRVDGIPNPLCIDLTNVLWVKSTRHIVLSDRLYWGTSGYGVDFGLDKYEQMVKIAKKAKGQVVINVNDIMEMRKAFDGLNF